MKIKEMPNYNKPREKLITYGVENLSNVDLISIILRTGTKNDNVIDVANNILKRVNNINELSNIGIRELSNIRGVGNIKAITLIAAIELGKRVYSKEVIPKMSLNNSYKVHEAFKSYFKGINQEKFMAIYLDTKKCLIDYKILFIGTVDKTIVHPREVYNEAIKLSASSIIIMHNHPSFNLEPSNNDIKITEQLSHAGILLGIPLIDSIITNGEEYYSFNDENIKK